MEIGIDLEECLRFKNLSEKVMSRVYTKSEIAYASGFVTKHEKLCAMWCVKEATIKALGRNDISYFDIEILHDSRNKPFVKINEKLKAALSKIGASEIKISISHTKKYATAVCVVI